MNIRIALLVFLVLKSVLSMDVERIDKEYFKILHKTVVDEFQEDVNADIVDTAEGKYQFTLGEEKRQFNRNISLSDRLSKILALRGTTLVHTEDNTKVILEPFKEIRIESDEGNIVVGHYQNTHIRGHQIVQKYSNGDVCDICKEKRWTGSVMYVPDKSELKLHSPIESSTCNYKLIVKGDVLGEYEKYKVLTATKLVHPENAQTNTTEPTQSQDIPEEDKAETEEKTENTNGPTEIIILSEEKTKEEDSPKTISTTEKTPENTKKIKIVLKRKQNLEESPGTSQIPTEERPKKKDQTSTIYSGHHPETMDYDLEEINHSLPEENQLPEEKENAQAPKQIKETKDANSPEHRTEETLEKSPDNADAPGDSSQPLIKDL
ncbi:hypothetical protein NEOKW01_0345 [Nematocida sp. AWRm80]|nr:hypothetical protein NEOKW01_0345 [Nematocida sp. AWRm80]